MVGKTISHYRILDKIGEGGMGRVYKAQDTLLDRVVALKFLSLHLLEREGARERFIHEAKAAATLDHPNICTIHQVGETEDEQMFLAMAYYDGETLEHRIERGPLSVEEATAIALQIAQGLTKAHAEGITHRDLKPGNVMLTKDGLVKILDFGLAKLAGATKITKTGSTVGTPRYMSPEQVEGKDTDPRSDIWSLGTILYEMLSGAPAFKGGHEAAVYYQILNQQPEPLRLLREGLPDILHAVVERALVKDREKRLGSAAEIADELQAVERELAGAGPLPSFRGMLLRQLRRPRFAIPGLAFLVALAASAAWLWVHNSRINWARNVALPEIARLLDEENVDAAFRLAQQAELLIPDNRELLDLQRYYATKASVNSAPPGADVYVKGYLNVDADWLYLGKTPIEGAALPPGYLRWRVTKDGFAPAEAARYSIAPVQQFTLHSANDTPPGMLPVPGGPYRFRGLPLVKLEDYWLDKYEVTNEQFQEFVDEGGYQKREYWKQPFVKDGKSLSWEEAMAEFRDATGRQGPSTWQLGTYGEGRSQFPVNGVSWYEAAAYAEFAGKSLPTIHHWFRAHATPQASEILRLSNFSGESTAQVGSQSGLSPYGSYDMAGNVREWCWNQIGEKGGVRGILGASWNEAPYRFGGLAGASPWDRSPTNGFRCAKYGTLPPAALMAQIDREPPDFTAVKPVSDEVFQVYRSFYSYERTALEPAVEAVDDSALHWRQEKVSFNAAYGGERVIAYLFLPRNAKPPYQTIIYFASGVARQSRSNDQMNSELRFVDFLPRIGRAVLFLIYKGTYERHLDHPVTGAFFSRDLVIAWSRDFSRSIDYLETRPDIDHRNLGYFSFSNPFMPIFSAVDGRIKAGAHIGTGLVGRDFPPEYSSIHFAPRAKEPTLLIGGRYDFIGPVETSQKPLLHLLGAPEKDKRLALFDTGHVVYPGPEMVKEVLDWFDRYLGPVEMTR
jgi:formylglycine-generating enzyme required for sulfatase activity